MGIGVGVGIGITEDKPFFNRRTAFLIGSKGLTSQEIGFSLDS